MATFVAWSLAAWADPDRPVHHDTESSSHPVLGEGVQGQVTASDGQPIEAAWVQAVSRDRLRRPIPELVILTEANGRYTWPLPPGTYDLTVIADGYTPATKRVTVRAGQVETLDFLALR